MKKIIILITMCLLFGCNKDKILLNKDVTYFSKFPIEKKVFFKDLYEFKEGEAEGLHLVDSTLIILNGSGNKKFFFYNYSLKSKKISNGYLHLGRGPGEGIGIWASGICSDRLWAFDFTTKKILTVNKKEILLDSFSSSFNEYTFKTRYYRLDFINSSSFYTVSNQLSTYKVQEIDFISGNLIKEFGEFGNIPSDMPLDLCKDVYTSYIYSNPSKKKLVVPYRFTDVVEIYDLKTETSIAIQGPENFDVDFNFGEDKDYGFFMLATDKTKKAFVNGAVTNEYIYLIYSGHFDEEERGSYGKYIFVYDWEGNPIKKIELDCYIYSLAVSEDNKTIYSQNVDTGYLVQAKIN